MSNFVTQWGHSKSQFGKNVLTLLQAGKDVVPDDIRGAIVALVKTDTGMTPALKLVDAAIGKKERTTAMKALEKVHKVIETTNKTFIAASTKAMDGMMNAPTGSEKVFENIARCVMDFNKEFHEFETGIAEAIQHIQEVKGGPGVAKISIFSLEGDMKAAVEKYKKGTKSFAALEKKFKVMDTVGDAATSMKSYTEAVAKSQVRPARTALLAYFDAVDALDALYKKAESDKSAPDADFLEAFELLCKSLRGIKKARGTDSLRNLDQLIADGH